MALATVAELYAFQGVPLPDPMSEQVRVDREALLEDASDSVRGYLRFSRYPVKADGTPWHDDHTRAIMRATCAQAVYFDGNPSARTETIAQYDSISAGSLTLSRRSGGADATATTDPRSGRAIQILTAAGLFTPRVTTY